MRDTGKQRSPIGLCAFGGEGMLHPLWSSTSRRDTIQRDCRLSGVRFSEETLMMADEGSAKYPGIRITAVDTFLFVY